MSDNPLSGMMAKSEHSFPMVIAITALILSIVSGVVNYRQNNLANLESSLRDTRDQLQLAKNDIADIKVKTVSQLVDAEVAIKNQQRVKDENSRLAEELADANARISELENQIRRMDSKLVSAKASAKAARRTASAVAAKTKKATPAQSASVSTDVLIAAADLDIYTQKIAPSLQQSTAAEISKLGFKPKFPPLPDSMSLASSTTVFYYDKSYKAVAQKLVQALSDITRGKVLIRKGASPYAKNKLILHIIAR